MKKTGKIDAKSLVEQARKSEDGEAFTVLARKHNCRIGVGARHESQEKTGFFVEVIVSLCASNHPVNLDVVEKNLLMLRQLEKKGYVLNCEEGGSVSCELAVASKNLTAEYETASLMIEKCLS